MIEIDVVIIGGGPAELQAALVLARTRKRVTTTSVAAFMIVHDWFEGSEAGANTRAAA